VPVFATGEGKADFGAAGAGRHRVLDDLQLRCHGADDLGGAAGVERDKHVFLCREHGDGDRSGGGVEEAGPTKHPMLRREFPASVRDSAGVLVVPSVMPRKKALAAEELLEMRRRRPTGWRGSHRARSRRVDKLGERAVEPARQRGLQRTARARPIDYTGLRKRMGREAEGKREAWARACVELLAPVAASGSACVIELEAAGGRP
jgi:hypothetical protein